MSVARALVQVQQRGRPEAEARAVMKTLSARGIDFEIFTHKRLARRQLTLDRETLVVGDVPTVRLALKVLQCQVTHLPTYPQSVHGKLGRRVWESTLGAAQDRVEETGEAIFLKPLDREKRFTGFVYRDRSEAFLLGSSSRRLRVLCAEVVDIADEHRVYVVDGEIRGAARYSGPPAAPPLEFARECIDAMSEAGDAVRGFAIDVGRLSDGRPVVIECNDGFGLGLYEGVDGEAYTDLLGARWEELMTSSTHASPMSG